MSVTNFIARKLINYQSEKSFAFKLRKKRAERIISLINECYVEHKRVNIIDVGGTKTYWKIIPREFLIAKNVHITAVNLPSTTSMFEDDKIFTFIDGDGCNLTGIKDKSFHLAHSNSVIEHVGSWENKVRFSEEIKRVAEKFYVQTPNYWFPMEPHFMTPFFQWFPKAARIKLVQNFNLGWYKKTPDYEAAKTSVEGCDLLTKKELKKLFPEAEVFKEKIALLTKSFVLIGN